MAKAKTKKIRRDARPPAENFPKVSVVLTSYNHAAYVAAAIESALKQTFTDFELLIVDDGSIDNSRDIIKSFDDPRIKLFLYEVNRGPLIAIRDAIKAARGKYIAVHHSDDLWALDKLEKQVAFLDANPNYAACFTWADFIDEHGNVHELAEGDSYKNVFEQSNRSRAEWLNYFFYNANCLCHPSAMVRRSAYEKFHLLEVHGLWQLPDYLMWVRLCFHADIFIMPERLTKFRLRRDKQENTSATTADRLIRADLEFFFAAQEFISNFTDDKFFLAVFPEAQKFVVGGKINRRFAFAQLCLSDKNIAPAAFQLVGLELLKDLLTGSATATELKTLYDYDEKSFLRDGGNFDVFNLAQKLEMLRAEIFIGDGKDFTLAAKKIISRDTTRKFYGRIDFDLDRPIKYLRFDPDSDFISVKLHHALINGEPRKIVSSNAGEVVNGFQRFWTSDPQIIFDAENLSGHVTFEVFGEVEENYPTTFAANVKEIFTQNVELQSFNDELNRRNDDLHKWSTDLQALNEKLQQQCDGLQQQCDGLQRQRDGLNAHIEKLQRQYDSLQRQRDKLQMHANDLTRQLNDLSLHAANLYATNQSLMQLNDELLNSNSWKMTEPLRAFRRWINYGSKDKALAFGRLFYRAVPLDDDKKNELKEKFYTRFEPFLKETERYKNWQLSTLQAMEQLDAVAAEAEEAAVAEEEAKAQVNMKIFEEELLEQPGKIAIQAHIFYLDLLEEMASYCENMPYKFDALISIVDETAVDKVRAAFEKITNVEKVIVRALPNRGRDVAPFIVGFGDLLPDYEFVAHIHSKKSLYTGSEQQNWRSSLFDALLGSSKLVRKIFAAFAANDSVGVIYPRPAANVPYAAYTWMSNRAIGHELLNRLGIEPNQTEYFDFPAGTMFWARTQVLRKFLALKLTFDDFPPEQGQNDGTIAHAFERSVLLAAKSEGMSYYEFNPATLAYTENVGCRNLWQYHRRAAEEFSVYVLGRKGAVSFDVFDTLIMRYVATPALVNEVISLKVADLLGYPFEFPKFRIEAENVARQKKHADVTLDEIYLSFAELTNLDAETCKEIRELEVSTEVSLCLPRPEVVAWFNEGVRLGKEIWLISDMYMQTHDLERLLKKCGVEGYAKLLISCETGMRKDTAAIWNDLVAKKFNDPDKLMHVGDNEMSDIQLAGDRHFGVYHIMSAINLLSQVPFGRNLLNELGGNMSLYAGICLGVVLAKKFHDPFGLRNIITDYTGRLILKSHNELGYWFYGAPLLMFMLWLIRQTKADGVKRILFLARDGYFLQPLYEFIAELLKVEPLPSDYFYASRRAVTVASIRKIEQAKELVKLRFEGTTEKFFRERFGMELGDETEIILPNLFSTTDCESIVEEIIDEHAEEILRHAFEERTNFESYLASLGGTWENVGVVDMGYSGTIQFCLQELMRKNFTGYYFATSAINRFGEAASDRMRGCFTEDDDYGNTTSALYRYQLLFETILTAPDAQLKHFDATGNPVFGKPEPGQKYFNEISAIHEGVKEFCRDVAEVFGDILLRVPLDVSFIDAWIRAFMSDDKIIAPELREIFTLDDDYCNTFHGNAFEFYQQGLDRPNGT